MKIPKGFTEDPFAYPDMFCPTCGTGFSFEDPFEQNDIFKCLECHAMTTIPQNILAQFTYNIAFDNYIKRRRGGPKPSTQAPPPVE